MRFFEQPTPSHCDPWMTCEQVRFKINMYRLRYRYFRSMAIPQCKRQIPNLVCIENLLVCWDSLTRFKGSLAFTLCSDPNSRLNSNHTKYLKSKHFENFLQFVLWYPVSTNRQHSLQSTPIGLTSTFILMIETTTSTSAKQKIQIWLVDWIIKCLVSRCKH